MSWEVLGFGDDMSASTSPQHRDATYQPVVITGMHRSGTSLVAQAFAAAGVFMGRDLLPPSENNRRGYIEPVSVITLHDTLLADDDRTWWDIEEPRSGASLLPVQFVDAARRVISHEFAGVDRWGFKDPRACLFLDLWNVVLPDARYVFVVREPAAAAFSLARRGDLLGATDPSPRTRSRLALRLWRLYNERLLAFRNHHPASSTTVLVPEEAVRNGGPRGSNLYETFGVDIAAAFDPDLLCRAVPRWLHELAAEEQVRVLYDELRNGAAS